MGLLDQLAGAFSGASGDSIGKLVKGLADDPSQLTSLVKNLDLGGLSEQVQSWIGTGENADVSAEQIKDALPAGQLDQIASNLGVDTDDAASGLAASLPGLIDKLTPDGQLPDLDQLKSRLGGLLG